MPTPERPAATKIVLVGAGLAGGLLACFLARRGYRVEVYERRSDPRVHGFAGGRSINLALSTRGIAALERAGLAQRVLAESIPMRGRMIHSPRGDLTFQPYSRNPQDAINSVGRGALSMTLLEAAAAHENVTFRFSCRCVDVDLDGPAAIFRSEEDEREFSVPGDLIIGADGAFSAVRGRLQKVDRFDYSQSYLEHGYKELTIPPTARGEFAMEKNALHIWPRRSYMMIALPNPDRSFTCTCFWPFRGPASFEAVQREAEVLPFFEKHFPDAVPLMPTLVRDFMGNPLGSLVTVRCNPWHDGRVALLGDAAHAIVPFYGQGANAGFEDCVSLDECIEAHAPDWERVLAEFTARRRPHTGAIADMALHNFIEMRDHVGSAAFLFRKKLESLLHRLFPRAFLPLYNMISFSTVPYAEARARARRQAAVIRGALVGAGVLVLLALALVWWLA